MMELLTKYSVLIPGMKVKPPRGECKNPSLHNHIAASVFRLTEYHFDLDSGIINEMNELGWSLDMKDKVTELAFNYLHDVPKEEAPEENAIAESPVSETRLYQMAFRALTLQEMRRRLNLAEWRAIVEETTAIRFAWVRFWLVATILLASFIILYLVINVLIDVPVV